MGLMMASTIWASAAIVAATLLCAAPARAQAGDAFAGTWGFQSDDYGNDDYGAAMSGVAIITAAATAHHYNVKLLAQEVISQRADGQSHLLVARENCTGADESGQLTVSCQLAEPLQNYQPDSFAIEAVDHDHLGGALTSSGGVSVNFNRFR
jgi:hypothetical protein